MGKNKAVEIFVEPDKRQDNGYRFWMKENNKETKVLDFSKDDEGMKRHEFHKITFKLKNTGGAKLAFSRVKDQVLWAHEVPQPVEICPPAGSKFDGLYVDPTAFPKDDELVVINENTEPKNFAFALNFVEQGTRETSSTKYICYDPVGTNRNGGTVSNTLRDVAIGIGCLALAGAAVLAFGVTNK